MAIVCIRIAGAENAVCYDDAVFSSAIDTGTEPIASGAPVSGSHVMRLDDIIGGFYEESEAEAFFFGIMGNM